MSGSEKEKRLKTVEVKKCYNISGINRALQETKELDKVRRENKGRDLKKKCDYSRALVAGGEKSEN